MELKYVVLANNSLKLIITGDELWYYGYDPEKSQGNGRRHQYSHRDQINTDVPF